MDGATSENSMDDTNYTIPQVITIQPDSLLELPNPVEHGNLQSAPINVTVDRRYSSESEYTPIVVNNEENLSTVAHSIPPSRFGQFSRDFQPIRKATSSNIILNRNTGFVRVNTGRTVSKQPTKVILSGHTNLRPNILSKGSRPVVKKVTPKLLLVPVSTQSSVTATSKQSENQNNPIVLSIGNLGTITEQRYFNIPVSESQLSGPSLSTVSVNKDWHSGTQISRVPKNHGVCNKKKPASPSELVGTAASIGDTSSKTSTKSTTGELDKGIDDKILGVKQNDIFFCNFCNYFAVFQTTDVFKHYVKHHKKSCTGINCNKLFNTEIEMQLHIYKDHPQLRGKLAPKEVLFESKCLETFKKPVYVFTRTSLGKVIGNKDAAFGKGIEPKDGEEDYLFTEKLFAPAKSYAKFMRQRYPDYNFKFKHLNETSKDESLAKSSTMCQWSCPHCDVVNNYQDVFNHIRARHPHQRFQPPVSVYSFDRSQGGDQLADAEEEDIFKMNGELLADGASQDQTSNVLDTVQKEVDPGGPVIGQVTTDTSNTTWNSEVSVTVNGLEIQATVDSNSQVKVPLGVKQESLINSSREGVHSLKDAVTAGTSDGVSSYLLTQKKALCHHYMPSFDTHRHCKRCRQVRGERCKAEGTKCVDCEGWSQELWAFVASMYPESDEEEGEEGKDGGGEEEAEAEPSDEVTTTPTTQNKKSSSKVKKCVYCSFYMPAKDRHSKCTRCRREKDMQTTTKQHSATSKHNKKSGERRSSKNKEKSSASPKTPVKNCFVHLQSSPHRDKKMCKGCRQSMFMFDLHNDCESCRNEKGVYCSANGMRCNICKLLGDSYWDTLQALTKTDRRSDSTETRQSFDNGDGGVSDDGDNDFMDEPEEDGEESQSTPNDITEVSTNNVNGGQHQTFQNIEEITLDHVPSDLQINIHAMYTFNPKKKCYECVKCKTVRSGFNARRYMIQHVKTHATGRLWGCSHCSYQHSKKAGVCKHILRDHPDKPLKVIRRMPRSDNRGWEIAGEYVINHKLRVAKCNDCGQRFGGHSCASNAARHISFKHPGQKFGCEMCKFVSIHKKNVSDHIAHKHPDDMCQIVSRSWGLHPSDICKIKKEKTASPGNSDTSYLKATTKSSDNAKKTLLGCGYCSFSTVYYRSVIRHSKARHRAKPIKVVHRKQTQDEAPQAKADVPRVKSEKTYSYNATTGWYQCTLCHYKTKSTFASKLMSVHYRIHHSAEAETWSHKCPHCPYSSLHKPYVTRHIKKKHPSSTQTPSTAEKPMTPTWEDSPEPLSLPESNDEEESESLLAPPAPVIVENIHNKYSYLPDSKVASCKICTHTTCGKHALTAMRDHVTGHLECSLAIPPPPVAEVDHVEEEPASTDHQADTTQSRSSLEPLAQKTDKDFVYSKAKKRAECKLCGYVTRGIMALRLIKNHLHNHQEKCKLPVFLCPYCNLNAMTKRSIFRHQKRKHPEKPLKAMVKQSSQTVYPGNPLHSTVKQSSSMHVEEASVDHVTDGSSDYTYKKKSKTCTCNLCGFVTRSIHCVKLMDSHLANHEENVMKPVYTCPYCRMDSNSRKFLKRHQKGVHPNKPEKVVRKELVSSQARSDDRTEVTTEETLAGEFNGDEFLTPEKEKKPQTHQKYNYLPDIKMASCKVCTFETQGKNACLEMMTHVKVHEATTKERSTSSSAAASLVALVETPVAPDVVYGCSYCDFTSAVSTKNVSQHIKTHHPDLIIKVKVRSVEQEPPSTPPPRPQSKGTSSATSRGSQKKRKRVDSYIKLRRKMKTDSKTKKLSKVIKQAKYFLQCPYCIRCCIFPSTMANHVRFVHPDCDPDIQCDSASRPTDVNLPELVKQACQSSCYVKVTKLEHMERFPVLQEVLETNGSVLRQKLDKGDKKWLGLLEGVNSEPSDEEMETDEGDSNLETSDTNNDDKVWKRNLVNSNYVELPNIDDVFDLKGKPKTIRHLKFTERDPVIFANRFRCICKKGFSDLTAAKIHAISAHASLFKHFGKFRFKEITDMYARAKFAPNKIYLCRKPECLFFSKLPSICELHAKCSGNPLRFWGSDDLAQVMYRNLTGSEPQYRRNSASSSMSVNTSWGEVGGSEADIVDLSGAWNYSATEVTDGMWRVSSSNSNFVMMPNIDDIIHVRGNPKLLYVAQFTKPSGIFKHRFMCRVCGDAFSDLTEAKIHFTKNHPRRYEWFGRVTFITVKDAVAVEKKCTNTVYMCANPGCVFVERSPSRCMNHSKCSGNPLQFWGEKSDFKLDESWEVLDTPLSSGAPSESEATTYASLPMPEKVMLLTGKVKVHQNSCNLRKVDFPNRFLCRVCDQTFDELTNIKTHCLREHSQRLRKDGIPGLFVAVRDIYAKLKYHVSDIFLCSKPECAFYTKQMSEVKSHTVCSRNYWEHADRTEDTQQNVDTEVLPPDGQHTQADDNHFSAAEEEVLPSDSEVDEVDTEETEPLSDNRDSENGGALSPTLSLIEEDLCMLTEGGLDLLEGGGGEEENQASLDDSRDINRQSSQGESISDTEVPVAAAAGSSTSTGGGGGDGVIHMSGSQERLQKETDSIGDTVQDTLLDDHGEKEKVDAMKSSEKLGTSQCGGDDDMRMEEDNLYDDLSDGDTLLNCSRDVKNIDDTSKEDLEVEEMADKPGLYESVSDSEFSMDFEESEAKNVAKETGVSDSLGLDNGAIKDATNCDKMHLSDSGDTTEATDNTGGFSLGAEAEKFEVTSDDMGDIITKDSESVSDKNIRKSDYLTANQNAENSQSSMKEKLKSTGILTTTYLGNLTPTLHWPESDRGKQEKEDQEIVSDSDDDTGIEKLVDDIATSSNFFLQPNLDESMDGSDILDSILDTNE